MNCLQTRHRYLWLRLIISIALGSVPLPALRAQETPAVLGTVSLVDQKTSKPISEAEAVAFADSLSAAVLKGDVAVCEKLFEWKATINKVTEVPFAPHMEGTRRAYREGCLRGLKTDNNVARTLIEAVKAGGAYKCVRINVSESEPYVIYRLTLVTMKFNYHQVFLERGQGGVIASDLFNFATNERMSDSVRRGWRSMAKGLMHTHFENLMLPPDPLIARAKDFGKFTKLVKQKKFGEALTIYQQLPEVWKKDRNALILRLEAASNVSIEEYSKVVEDYRDYYPDDLGLDFVLIGGYSGQMQYDKALECLDRTNKHVGGDSALLVQRASLLMLLQRVPEAKKTIDDAILGEPDFDDTYAMALDVSLAEPNFDDTVRYLNILESQFGYQWADLREVPEYSEFVKSPQYRNWIETQTKK